MEEWKDINGYEGLYQVSNWGRVKSLEREFNVGYGGTKHTNEHIIKPTEVGKGYLHICLSKNNVRKWFRVHKLVALHFIPNPNNYPVINHKDENPKNNKVENLEWCTQSYNNTYGGRTSRMAETQSKQIYQYTLDGEFVKLWSSVKEAKESGFHHADAVARCERKQDKGYKWSYKPL